jgi:hypothetical protein
MEALMSSLPPQRRGDAGQGQSGRSPTSPKEAAAAAEERLGLPCFFAGQKVKGLFGCVADQFQINNRGALPQCPQCGELVWAYMGGGERPVPEGEEGQAQPAHAAPAPKVEEGVKLEEPSAPVKVEEGVKLEP